MSQGFVRLTVAHPSGRSAIDAEGKYIVCSNLHNGFDLYDLRRRSFVRSIPQRLIGLQYNVPLPALFVGTESDVMLLGSACGEVLLASPALVPGQPLVLDHGLLQSWVYTVSYGD